MLQEGRGNGSLSREDSPTVSVTSIATGDSIVQEETEELPREEVS